MTHLDRAALALLLPAAIGATDVHCQVRRVQVSSIPACKTCSVELSHVVALGDREGPGFVSLTQVVTRDSRGQYFVAHPRDRGRVTVFDSTGRFVSKFGHGGEGPGEYRSITRIVVTPDDIIHLFDGQLRRHTVLSPSRQVVRTSRLELPPSLVGTLFLTNGWMVVNANIRSRERIGLPLHLVDPDGKIRLSFGAEDPIYLPGISYQMDRALAYAGAGRIWSAQKTRYVVELWDTAGTKQAEFIRHPDWFEPWDKDGPLSPTSPPLPRREAIQQDAQGRLWVLLTVPARDWTRGLQEKKGPSGITYYPDQLHLLFDSILEVIDPESGTLIASGRFPQYLQNFVDEKTVLGYREDSEGFPYIDIWRVELIESP